MPLLPMTRAPLGAEVENLSWGVIVEPGKVAEDEAGPPFAELVRIVERARYLLTDDTPRVAEQHVVSKVLSGRFCLPARPGAGR